MTKFFAFTAAALLATSAAAMAGDVAKGEKDFKKCKSCHMIVDASGETIVKGGKTGPNLFGVVGSPVAHVDGFKYGDGILAVAEAGMVWSEELLIEYVADPSKFIKTHGGDKRSKMTFRLKDGTNVAAYLASFSPAMAEEAPAEDAPAEDVPAEDAAPAAEEAPAATE